MLRLLGLLALLALALGLALSVGARPVTPAVALEALRAYDPTNADHVTLMAIRLPRLAAGLIAGGALGIAGTVMQVMTRNPLADPGILGVNSGAAFALLIGATVLGTSDAASVALLTFPGAALASALVFILGGGLRGDVGPVRLTLAGAALNALLLSLVTAIVLIRQDTLDMFRFWVAGSLTQAASRPLLEMALIAGAGGVFALAVAPQIEALSLGSALSRGLGPSRAGCGPAAAGRGHALHRRRRGGRRTDRLPRADGAAACPPRCGPRAAPRAAGLSPAGRGSPSFRRHAGPGGHAARRGPRWDHDGADRRAGVPLGGPPPAPRGHRMRRALALCLLLLAATLAALMLGPVRLSPTLLWQGLSTGEGPGALVLGTIRGPRVMTALGAGAVLGLSGALFQALFRNPLAAPDIMGFTAGAGLTIIAAIALGLTLPPPLLAAGGGLVAALLVALLSQRRGHATPPLTMILVGLGIGFIASALSSFLLTLLPHSQAAEAQRWLTGSLAARDWSHVAQVWGIGALLAALALAQLRRLAALELGEDLAAGLGLRVGRARMALAGTAVLLAAAGVAVAGPVPSSR
ncbi:iron chelate uptake ABC transporter family permease subunit [Yangia mangrovi]|uniref:Iron chelate uptake ABC transporter family permease subunit n=1 Tax=Alloyangia mangrovi TaxID=1779329 RepID=A0ABT2KJ16_9RHOB|nr:iron chelate uptake ABC transporter family permease subunit [Alloyangia mangrovi]